MCPLLRKAVTIIESGSEYERPKQDRRDDAALTAVTLSSSKTLLSPRDARVAPFRGARSLQLNQTCPSAGTPRGAFHSDTVCGERRGALPPCPPPPGGATPRTMGLRSEPVVSSPMRARARARYNLQTEQTVRELPSLLPASPPSRPVVGLCCRHLPPPFTTRPCLCYGSLCSMCPLGAHRRPMTSSLAPWSALEAWGTTAEKTQPLLHLRTQPLSSNDHHLTPRTVFSLPLPPGG